MLSAPLVVNVVQETSRNQSAYAVGTPAANPRPMLVYDGDCGFCGYWACYWQKLTGDRVEYRPYPGSRGAISHDFTSRFPARGAILSRLMDITPGAAEASFLTLSYARGKRILARPLQGICSASRPCVWSLLTRSSPRTARLFFRASLLLWGRKPRAAALRPCLPRSCSCACSDSFTFGLRLLSPCRRKGPHRQPWASLPLAELVDALAEPSRAGALLPHADVVLPG